MLRQLTTALAVATLGAAALAPGATAGTDKKDIFPATCDDREVRFVVNGNGDFTAARVEGTTQQFIPQAFDFKFTFTTGGTTQTESFAATKSNLREGFVVCKIDFSDGEGTFTAEGTVTGFFTPVGKKS